MKKHSSTRKLRSHPDLDQHKRQAKELLRAYRAGDAEAIREVTTHYHQANPDTFALHDAQLVVARSHGFESWQKLKAFVDNITVQRLAEFVRTGDAGKVLAMLKARPELVNMEMAYVDEHRPIHFAVLHRKPEMVRLLMQHGADARKGIHPHRDATEAVTLARERGYDEIVAIIEEEERKRQAPMSHSTAGTVNREDELSQHIRRRDTTAGIAMIERDPSLIHRIDSDGWTPLHRSAEALDERLVVWLVDHGADVNQRGKDGRTPLDLAAGRSAKDADVSAFGLIVALLRGHGANLTAPVAVAVGDAEWLRTQHSAGALVNTIDWSNGGLLTIAAKHDRADILALLLDFGFDPNERVRWKEGEEASYSQGYPLWYCAATGKYALTELLLQRGADPNVHVDSSGSPVYSAYSHRQWQIADLLQRYGGIVGADIVGLYRKTAIARQMLLDAEKGSLAEGTVSPGRTLAEDLLRFAASGGDAQIVQMALERVDWRRDDPRWFGMLAEPLSFWNHIPWLYAGNPELDRGTYIDCFRLILNRCDPNVTGSFGRTPLHEVAATGDHVKEEETAAFAKALLDAGARTNARDNLLKSTPLAWACRWGRIEMVKLLLARGADPVEANSEPWATPKAWAKKMGHTAVLAQLL